MRTFVLPALACLLVACGPTGRPRVAADACLAEIHTRLAGKRVEVAIDTLAASAVAAASDTPDTLQLTAPIVFDPGLSGEYTQTIDCRVRFNGAAASVIFLQFNWSMDDLKKGR